MKYFLKGKKFYYWILKKIGAGGNAQVYLAMEIPSGKYRAVKTRRKEEIGGLQALEAEARLMKTLTFSKAEKYKSYIPQYYGYFQRSEWEYLVMEYLKGSTVGDYLRKGGSLCISDLLNMIDKICNILEELHIKIPSVLYLDLNPDNIFLEKNGSVKLIDFGAAAAWYFRNEMQEQIMYATRTFAAPEQYRGEADQTTDIYSLGILMHQVWNGKEMFRRKEGEKEKYIRNCMEAWITKCTGEIPGQRYQSVQELHREICQAMSHIEK